jgi:hypothetical protein
MDTHLTRRSTIQGGIALALATMSPMAAFPLELIAQEAANLPDFPQLDVVIGDTDLTVTPSEVAAGRYLVSVTNENTTYPQSLYAAFMQTGGEATLEALNVALNDPEAEGPPEWYYTAWSPGGISVAAGETGQMVIDLPAGTYAVHPDQGGAMVSGAELTVTGEMPETLPEVPVTLTLSMAEMSFTFDPAPTTGEHWLAVVNEGEQPHFAAIFAVPEGTTTEDFLALMASFQGPPTASPVATNLTFDELLGFTDTSLQSPETTMWTNIEFTAGTYLIACFVPDPATGIPHVMSGMLDVFVVA